MYGRCGAFQEDTLPFRGAVMVPVKHDLNDVNDMGFWWCMHNTHCYVLVPYH